MGTNAGRLVDSSGQKKQKFLFILERRGWIAKEQKGR